MQTNNSQADHLDNVHNVLVTLQTVGAWIDATDPHPYLITPGSFPKGICTSFLRSIFDECLSKGFIVHSPTRHFPYRYVLSEEGMRSLNLV